MITDWQPSASLKLLAARAVLLQQIRNFLSARNILEVETPILSQNTVTDPNIESFETEFQHPGKREKTTFFLNTSPEYAMKRLLVAGSGPIYQITRVFRKEEAGKLHNPEFTMLEWYCPGFDHQQLIDELDQLLCSLNFNPVQKKTYADVFEQVTGINPHSAKLSELQKVASDNGLATQIDQRSDLLDFIFSHCISDHLGREFPLIIYNYPACQAALARITDTDPPVAERFELFINGLEIANGFHELCDVAEQENRFQQDNVKRRNYGRKEVAVDQRFLAALNHGLPACAGVAVGIDRLLMAMYNCQDISEVMPFPIDQA